MGDSGRKEASDGTSGDGVRAEGANEVRPSRIADGYNILARDFDLAVAAARLSGLQSLLLFYARRESWTMAIIDTPKGEKITESAPVPFMLNLPIIAQRHGIKDVKFLYTVHHQLEAMKLFIPAEDATGYFEIEKDYREWVDAKTHKPLFDAIETGIILAEKNIGRHKNGGEKPTGVGKTPLAKWGKTRHGVGKTHTPSGENSYSGAGDTIGTRAESERSEKEHTEPECEPGAAEEQQSEPITRHPQAEIDRIAALIDRQWPMHHYGTKVRNHEREIDHLVSFEVALAEARDLRPVPTWDYFFKGMVKKVDANGGKSTTPKRIRPQDRSVPAPKAEFVAPADYVPMKPAAAMKPRPEKVR